MKIGDRIFPCYDVPVVDGRVLYSRAETPLRGEGEIVVAISEGGFPLVALRAVGSTKDGKPVLFERKKFVSERSVWTDDQVRDETDRLVANISRRLRQIEEMIDTGEGIERMRKCYRALNRLDTGLVEATHGR